MEHDYDINDCGGLLNNYSGEKPKSDCDVVDEIIYLNYILGMYVVRPSEEIGDDIYNLSRDLINTIKSKTWKDVNYGKYYIPKDDPIASVYLGLLSCLVDQIESILHSIKECDDFTKWRISIKAYRNIALRAYYSSIYGLLCNLLSLELDVKNISRSSLSNGDIKELSEIRLIGDCLKESLSRCGYMKKDSVSWYISEVLRDIYNKNIDNDTPVDFCKKICDDDETLNKIRALFFYMYYKGLQQDDHCMQYNIGHYCGPSRQYDKFNFACIKLFRDITKYKWASIRNDECLNLQDLRIDIVYTFKKIQEEIKDDCNLREMMEE